MTISELLHPDEFTAEIAELREEGKRATLRIRAQAMDPRDPDRPDFDDDRDDEDEDCDIIERERRPSMTWHSLNRGNWD